MLKNLLFIALLSCPWTLMAVPDIIEEIPVIDSVKSPVVTSPTNSPDTTIIEKIRVIDSPASVFVTDNGSSTQITVTDSLGQNTSIELLQDSSSPVRINIWDMSGSSVSCPQSADALWELIPNYSVDASSFHKTYSQAFAKLIYGGVTIPVNANPGIGTGWEAGIGQLFAVSVSPWFAGPSLSVGAGFGFRRFSVKSDYFLRSDGGNLYLAPAPVGTEKVSGSINSFTIHFPVMITQRLYRHFALSAGVWLNLNTYSTASTSYSTGDDNYKNTYKHLDQRLLSLDYVGQIGFSPAFSGYVRYSPHRVFRSEAGPAWRPLSAGIMFNF